MSGFSILILIIMIQSGRHCVTAQSVTDSPVYQPDEEISVNIGDSATLQCCIIASQIGITAWFKQLNWKRPQIIVTVYSSSGERFYNESEKSRFQISRSPNCFNLIILNTIQSDEAMYYCALTTPKLVFADGTYLTVRGEGVPITSETSAPALCNYSKVLEPTLHGSSINTNMHEKTVLGLGLTLGLCALLLFSLSYIILRTRKDDKINGCREETRGTRQEPEPETLNYAPLNFTRQKAEGERRKRDSSNECVYTDVRYYISDS